MKRSVLQALLLGAIAAVMWYRGDLTRLGVTGTPHEQYARALGSTGLDTTALGRDWLAAAEDAIANPQKAAMPLDTTIRHTASEPRAYGYAVELRRGRLLDVRWTIDAPAQIFADVFRLRPGEEPDRVASADLATSELRYEATRNGTYILRIQPELLRGGTLRIAQRAVASLTFPVGSASARVRSVFGDPRDGGRRDHHGVDIFAPRGTPVVAAAPGLVTSVRTTAIGGNVVWILDAKRGQSHYYAHLASQAVKTGEPVRAGEVVGYVGSTGNARTTPPHLHFGIYGLREGPIDPLPFVAGGRVVDVKTAETTERTGQSLTRRREDAEKN